MTWNVLLILVLNLAVGLRAGAGQVGPPSSPDLFDEAKALTTREDWQKAIARFRQFLREHSGDPRASEARFWIGFSLVKSAEFEEAIRELEPFESTLAQDKWADDALLQLGHAYRGHDDDNKALAVWKRLRQKYPDSVWRTEAVLQIIDVLFHSTKDYAACLTCCEEAVHETGDHAVTTEARYIGAYCLNALSKYDGATIWMDQCFAPDDAVEEGWRRVLFAHRDLRQGQVARAIANIESIDADFPDLDSEARLDLTLRAAAMLTRENQAGRSRELLIAALKHTGHSEENTGSLLDQLKDTASGDDSFAATLKRLADDASLPPLARVLVREHQVEALREHEQAEQAESLLREALTKEKTEYGRFRAVLALAELLSDDQEDREAALQVLNDLLPSLRRRDLVYRVREAIKNDQAPKEDQ
jgi:tetratricopeptide (TPR) repeat protein